MDGQDIYATQAPAPDHQSASLMPEAQPAPAQPTAAADGLKLNSVSIRKATNGGFIVNCSKSPATPAGPTEMSPQWQDKDYAFATVEELFAYLQTELA